MSAAEESSKENQRASRNGLDQMRMREASLRRAETDEARDSSLNANDFADSQLRLRGEAEEGMGTHVGPSRPPRSLTRQTMPSFVRTLLEAWDVKTLFASQLVQSNFVCRTGGARPRPLHPP